MISTEKNDFARTLRCPRCGNQLQVTRLVTTSVNRCNTGCGVWIDQANIDAGLAHDTRGLGAAGRLAGFWRSRRLARN